MKKLVSALLACLLAAATAPAAYATSILGYLDFLPEDSSEPYYYFGDRETGYWEYIDQTLHITIHRLADTENNITWFETDIRCKDTVRFVTYMAAGDDPGDSLVSPKVLADESGAVLVFNDDYFGARRMTGGIEGIILRNGRIYSDRTFDDSGNRFPPLDILGIDTDGVMKTFATNEHTAEEYAAMSILDTFAFGPVLVQDGALGPRMYDEKYVPYREPRCALGMVAPGHYVLLTVKGRTDDSSGVKLRWLADRMLELGAVEALNLDGGATTALYIMGDLITHPENLTRQDVRGVNSMIGIGVRP